MPKVYEAHRLVGKWVVGWGWCHTTTSLTKDEVIKAVEKLNRYDKIVEVAESRHCNCEVCVALEEA
jgi:hypothetical protein